MSSVSLRPINLADTDKIVSWRNNPTVKRYLFTQTVLTNEQHILYYKDSILTGKCAQFIIEMKDNKKNISSIGTIFIKNIDNVNHCGEYGIFIGDDLARGKGYAKKATQLILEYGFEELKLHRISLKVMADNFPALKVYKAMGFKQEGIERDAYLREDGYVDIILMAILENEWVNS